MQHTHANGIQIDYKKRHFPLSRDRTTNMQILQWKEKTIIQYTVLVCENVTMDIINLQQLNFSWSPSCLKYIDSETHQWAKPSALPHQACRMKWSERCWMRLLHHHPTPGGWEDLWFKSLRDHSQVLQEFFIRKEKGVDHMQPTDQKSFKITNLYTLFCFKHCKVWFPEDQTFVWWETPHINDT